MRHRLRVQRALLHVTDDSDDAHPGAVVGGIAPGDALADGIGVLPERPCQRPVDDGNRFGGRDVLPGDVAAALERDAERLEVRSPHPLLRHRVWKLSRRVGLTIDREGAALADAERELGGRPGGVNAGQA